jgi:hypothetical protein
VETSRKRELRTKEKQRTEEKQNMKRKLQIIISASAASVLTFSALAQDTSPIPKRIDWITPVNAWPTRGRTG